MTYKEILKQYWGYDDFRVVSIGVSFVFFSIMPQTPPHCNAAYSASAASSSAVSPGCTASEMP